MGLAQRPQCDWLSPVRAARWPGMANPLSQAAVPTPAVSVGKKGPSSPVWAAPAPALLLSRMPRVRARLRHHPARRQRDTGPAGLLHQHKDIPTAQTTLWVPSPALPHLQGIVEEFAHTAEAATLALVLLQPPQCVRDVPLLNGHIGSGLPKGLEDKRRQPGARETSEG